MTHHNGAVPDTKRKPDWRDLASCREKDPELFFPTGAEGGWKTVIEEAKAVCRRCPVTDDCLRFALDEGVSDGIFGGLTEKERASISRSVRRGRTTADDIAAKADAAREPHRERTLQTIFDDNTTRLYGGHLAWTGSDQIYLKGRKYTPRQVAFITDRGRAPEGPVLLDCGSSDCVLPAHLTDQQERSYCGTSEGYRRRTGTSKVAA